MFQEHVLCWKDVIINQSMTLPYSRKAHMFHFSHSSQTHSSALEILHYEFKICCFWQWDILPHDAWALWIDQSRWCSDPWESDFTLTFPLVQSCKCERWEESRNGHTVQIVAEYLLEVTWAKYEQANWYRIRHSTSNLQWSVKYLQIPSINQMPDW